MDSAAEQPRVAAVIEKCSRRRDVDVSIRPLTAQSSARKAVIVVHNASDPPVRGHWADGRRTTRRRVPEPRRGGRLSPRHGSRTPRRAAHRTPGGVKIALLDPLRIARTGMRVAGPLDSARSSMGATVAPGRPGGSPRFVGH